MSKRAIFAVVVGFQALIAGGAGGQEFYAGSRVVLKTRLVRAFEPCTDPSLEHAPPWAAVGGACAALPSSPFAFAPGKTGYVTVTAVTGPFGRVSDLRIDTTLSGVQTDAGVLLDGAVFALTGTIRLTDRGCEGMLCTVVDLSPFALGPVRCGRAAEPPLAPGRCRGTTSLNAQLAGAVTAGRDGTVEVRDLVLRFDDRPAFVPGSIIP